LGSYLAAALRSNFRIAGLQANLKVDKWFGSIKTGQGLKF
jgi:hypothetical protein